MKVIKNAEGFFDLLLMDKTNSIFFILVEPQLGENIGAVARVMSNFGYYNLRIVNPRYDLPNRKALEMSANGAFVLEKATVLADFRSAIQDINYLVATSANTRYLAKPVYTPEGIGKRLSKNLKADSAIKLGIVFGRERSGLTNEEVSFADELVQIKTAKINSSLNLAQAVCIVAYELAKETSSNQSNNCRNFSQKANQSELSHLMEHLTKVLDEGNFFQVPTKKAGIIINIRNLLMRANLSSQDVRTIRGIIRAIGRSTI